MIWILVGAFVCAAAVTLGVIASSHRHGHWSADHDLSGPQKMHSTVVSRVGGLGIFGGIVAGTAALLWREPAVAREALWVLACTLPAFLSGLWEDFTKAVSPRRRLLAIALSGLLGVVLVHLSFGPTGWPAFDELVSSSGVGAVAAVFVVTGVANSVNIIDGLNGLASMCVALMMVALAYIALQVGDRLVAGLALATLGASLGFFMWNYPRGLVFLGDGGAYLLGFLVAVLGMLLIQRNPQVSILTPLVLVAYPVFETVFTMYRRRVLRGRPMTMPDGIHLHTLIYRRLMRWAVGAQDSVALTRGNSRTSPYLWVLSSVAVVPAAIWWDNTPALAATLVIFVALYLRTYWLIVRFRRPFWLVTPRRAPDDDGGAPGPR
jgi:UDP-N-acetylmuramyl pentapeptide phosphotransferase/UDP-N-acetylglucosamine-1-phosphate transferase